MFALLLLLGLAVLVVTAIILTEVENFGIATLTLVACVVGAQWFHIGGFNLLQYVETHAVASILYTLGYVIVGIGWSFVKWFSYLMGFRDKYREQKDAFLKSKDLAATTVFDDELTKKFQQFLQDNHRYGDPDYGTFRTLERPRASKNKARIVAWMSLWPCSVIGTVLNDPVRRLFNFLFNQFKALYQRMADRVFVNDVEMK